MFTRAPLVLSGVFGLVSGLACGSHFLDPATRVDVTTLVGGEPSPATWAAYQDGDGPWKPLWGEGGRYAFASPSSRYGVAIACGQEQSLRANVRIVHATRATAPALTLDCSALYSFEGFYNVTGTIRGLATGSPVVTQIGSRSGWGDTYRLRANPGVFDATFLSYLPGSGWPALPDKLLVVPEVAITHDLVLDVDFANGVSLVPHSFAMPGATSSTVQFLTKRGTAVTLSSGSSSVLVPLAAQRPTETHVALAALDDARVLPHGRRIAARYLKEPADIQLTAPPGLEAATVSAEGTVPYVRFRASWSPSDWAHLYRLDLLVGMDKQDWRVLISADWLGAATSYVLPDFSAIPGWSKYWGLTDLSSDLFWSVAAVRANRPIGQALSAAAVVRWTGLLDVRPPLAGMDGLEIQAAILQGPYPMP